MDPAGKSVDTLIVLAPDQASFYEFVKARQEAGGRTLVVLDRRRAGPPPDPPTRTHSREDDRRRPPPEAALALMSVLGFMILHRDEGGWSP